MLTRKDNMAISKIDNKGKRIVLQIKILDYHHLLTKRSNIQAKCRIVMLDMVAGFY